MTAPIVEPTTAPTRPRVLHAICPYCEDTRVGLCGQPLRGIEAHAWKPEDECVVCNELLANGEPCTSPDCPLRRVL